MVYTGNRLESTPLKKVLKIEFQSFLISWSQWTRPMYDQHPEPEAIMFRRPENKWLSFRSTNFKHWPSSPFIKSKCPLIWSLKYKLIQNPPWFYRILSKFIWNFNFLNSGFQFLKTFKCIRKNYFRLHLKISDNKPKGWSELFI